MAPVVSISVYSRARRVIRRWNTRQCRSVQSIMGAMAKRQSLKMPILSDFSGTSCIFLAARLGPFLPVLDCFVVPSTTMSYHFGKCRTVLSPSLSNTGPTGTTNQGTSMGTIVARKRKDGSTGYTAQILRKKKGAIILREAQTFDRRQAASVWLKRRETELSEPGAIDRAKVPEKSLANAIDRYIAESRKVIGKTKAQVLAWIKGHDIANMDCGEVRSQQIVDFANELLAGGRQPSTVGNYISHLAAIFAIARPAWGYRLEEIQMKDAQAVLRRMGIIGKSKSRDRRPTLPELDLLMQHFVDRSKRDPNAALMHRVIAFAIFSTRRQEEITRQEMSDVDSEHSRLLVRDMKHPGEKIGNDS
jgi:hypothetical protein